MTTPQESVKEKNWLQTSFNGIRGRVVDVTSFVSNRLHVKEAKQEGAANTKTETEIEHVGWRKSVGAIKGRIDNGFSFLANKLPLNKAKQEKVNDTDVPPVAEVAAVTPTFLRKVYNGSTWYYRPDAKAAAFGKKADKEFVTVELSEFEKLGGKVDVSTAEPTPVSYYEMFWSALNTFWSALDTFSSLTYYEKSSVIAEIMWSTILLLAPGVGFVLVVVSAVLFYFRRAIRRQEVAKHDAATEATTANSSAREVLTSEVKQDIIHDTDVPPAAAVTAVPPPTFIKKQHKKSTWLIRPAAWAALWSKKAGETFVVIELSEYEELLFP